VYKPQVYELIQGSTGISGKFQIDLNNPGGPNFVSFNESEMRLQRKLEEFTTIVDVTVHRFEYPTPTSGGWGAV
jgi:hypothetical protein